MPHEIPASAPGIEVVKLDVYVLIVRVSGKDEACREFARRMSGFAEISFVRGSGELISMECNLAKWQPI